MGTQTTVLAGLGLLALAMAPIQLLAYMRMRRDFSTGIRELGDLHGREISGSAATLVFLGYALLSGYLHTHDLLGFDRTPPFQAIYHLAQTLIHGSKQDDQAWMYPWIWGSLTIIPPCLTYAALNAYVARFIWTKIR